MMYFKNYRWLVLGLAFFGAACGGNSAPDVSGVKVNLTARRFDRDFSAIDTTAVGAGLQRLQQQYPDFLNFYLDTLMGFGVRGRYVDTALPVREGVRVLLTQKDYRGLFDTVAAHFPDTKAAEAAITDAYRYYRHYVPQAPEQRPLVFFTSNLNRYNAITYENLLGIGLDMYLGPNYPFYRSVEIPDYMIRRLTPAYIPVDLMIALYREQHPFEPENQRLIDLMIQRGQELYFLTKVLPQTPDSIRLGYAGEQLHWLENNESYVYHFYIQKKLLHETNMLKVIRYVTDGPRDVAISAEAPGNTGSWIGFRIFSAWMDKHPDLPLAEALQPKDGQQILQESGYKPK
jgi:hypothetical protein